jgi:hypothetical protein
MKFERIKRWNIFEKDFLNDRLMWNTMDETLFL